MGFLSSLFGGDDARRDIQRGRVASRKELDIGEAGALEQYDTAIGGLTPYEEIGRSGLEDYRASLGLRGPEEQARIQGIYFSDPVQNAIMDRVTRANTRRFTGIGMGNSGAATQSLTNALLDRWGSYQDRLAGLGTGGYAAASDIAGIRTGKGDIKYMTGQHKAGIETNAANAMAASRSTGINNLIGLVGAGARLIGAGASAGFWSDRRLKENIIKVGKLPSGLPVYTFNFKGHPETYRGVMADEARELFPQAVGERDGYLTVDYSRIG